MDLYLKQKLFSWTDKFHAYDSEGNVRYTVEGQLFSFGKKLYVYDTHGKEAAYIEQKLFTLLPRYYVYKNGSFAFEVVKELSFFHPRYSVPQLGIEVNGDFWDHEYGLYADGQCVSSVSKEWFTLGDAYRISVSSNVDEADVLATVLVIDACIQAQRQS